MKTGIFHAPLIQTLVNKVWFKNKEDDGIIHPEFSKNDVLPMATIAFVQTVVSLILIFTFNLKLFLLPNVSLRLKITLTSGSLVNTLMFLSLLRPTRSNTVLTSNLSWILRRKHVWLTSSLISSNICSRLLGVLIINHCCHGTYCFPTQKTCQSFQGRFPSCVKHFGC